MSVRNILGVVLKTSCFFLLAGNFAFFYRPATVHSSGLTTNISQAEHKRTLFGVRPPHSPPAIGQAQEKFSNNHRQKPVSLNSGKQFVRQTYQDLLFREPLEDELNDSLDALQNKKISKSELVISLLNSPEFVEKIAPVVRLYQANYGSIDHPADLLYWLDLHNLGLTLKNISNSMAEAESFKRNYEGSSNRDFVISVYQNLFGRQPEPDGLEFWKNLLDSGKLTRGQLMDNLSESDEYQLKLPRSFQLSMLTIGLLKRIPDQRELDFWLNNVDSNAELGFVNKLLVSDEYKSRFK